MRRSVSFVVAIVMVTVLVPSVAAFGTVGQKNVLVDTTLTEDHNGIVVIMADNVSLDCAGYTISGPGVAGIRIDHKTGVTIKNCGITGFGTAIEVASSTFTVVKNNNIYGNIGEGIAAGNSSDNIFKDNTLTNNGTFGFLANNADSNTFTANDVTGHTGQQFHFANGSDNNLIRANTASGGEGGYVFLGSEGNVVKNNYATGYSSGGYGISEGSAYNTIQNNVADNVGTSSGFGITESHHNKLIDNTSIGGHVGFSLDWGATDNTLKGNSTSGHTIYGYAVESSGDPLQLSDRNLLVDNTTEGGQIGFFIRIARGNTLEGNDASGASGPGFLLLDNSNGNTLASNKSTGNLAGFSITQSDGNTLSRNHAEDNQFSGFFVWHSAKTTADRNKSFRNTTGFFAIVRDGSDSVFRQNTACHNTSNDAADFSQGSYADPATWEKNRFCTPLVIGS